MLLTTTGKRQGTVTTARAKTRHHNYPKMRLGTTTSICKLALAKSLCGGL